jgi:hypothetical protein
VRAQFCADLIAQVIGSRLAETPAHLWLWRRLPHPDTLVPGGPEIDFGIHTGDTLILGEAKWRSRVASGQGKEGMKDQIRLRAEFCEKFGSRFYPGISKFIVLLVSSEGRTLTEEHYSFSTLRLTVSEATWADLGAIASNPWRAEFLRHLHWRSQHSMQVDPGDL